MYSFQIFENPEDLPNHWEDINNNIFLSSRYFKALAQGIPENIQCFYVGFYDNEKLIGQAVFQCISIYKTKTLGNKEHCVKRQVKNFAVKKLCGNVLFLGNNMLTGQHAFSFLESVNQTSQNDLLQQALAQVKRNLVAQGFTIHLTSIKDFSEQTLKPLHQKFNDYYVFETQPNMVFEVDQKWQTFSDYIASLSKKYRLQYNRASNKMKDVSKRKLNLDDILLHEDVIYDLYLQVVDNASFNTFILPKKHFYQMKKYLPDDLFFYGYFSENKLIGFSTLIKNGDCMATYFLGYDEPFQKSHLLYLNMLYDMVAFSINQKFKKVIFGRTAMEIKSSIGAKPQASYGLIRHKTSFLQKQMDKLFNYFDPKVKWIERHPFKNETVLSK